MKKSWNYSPFSGQGLGFLFSVWGIIVSLPQGWVQGIKRM
jgi:hypothetical protein